MPIDWNNVLTTNTPIVIPIITALLGYLGGNLTHSLKIKGDNINVKRERLLRNISKVEDALSLLLEYSWLNADITKYEALIESSALNIETTKKELAALREDEARKHIKIKNATNQNKLNILIKEYEKLKLQSDEIGRKTEHYEQMKVEIKREIDRIKPLLSDYKKRLGNDDIGSTLNIIDPNGQISGYFKELIDISGDPKRHFYSDTRVIELKGKINEYFDDQIRKIR